MMLPRATITGQKLAKVVLQHTQHTPDKTTCCCCVVVVFVSFRDFFLRLDEQGDGVSDDDEQGGKEIKINKYFIGRDDE